MGANHHFKGVAHFFSTWGLGDSAIAVLGVIGTGLWATDGKPFDWLGLGVGLCAIFVYWNIAFLTRPDDGDQQKPGDK